MQKRQDDWLRRLAAPFVPDVVKWRVGAVSGERGMALAYVDARIVMDRLDQVLGPLNWQTRFHLGNEGRVVCELGVRSQDGGVEFIWKGDGAGATDVEGDKGSISDAFKRAAVHWGIGRYLYSVEAPWVRIVKRGKTSVIHEEEHDRLRAYLGAKARAGAPPEGGSGGPTPPPVSTPEDEPSPADSKRSAVPPPRSGFVTATDKKKLYAANFRALKAIGYQDAEINELSAKDRFEPVNYAVAHVGCNRLEDLHADQVTAAIEAMAAWIKRAKWNQEQRAAGGPAPAPMDDDPADGPGWDGETL